MTEACRESQPNTGEENSATFKMEPLSKQTKETFSVAANTRKGLNKRVRSKSAKSGRHKTCETLPVGYETTGRRKEKRNCPVESKGYTLRVLFFSGTGGASSERTQRGIFPSMFGIVHIRFRKRFRRARGWTEPLP